MRTIGEVEAVFRYPIKSMAGERLDAAELGWSGVAGDRRLALRRLEDTGGKPWLTASKLAELLRYTPTGRDADGLPTHVRLPDGRELPARGEELDGEITRRHGKPVQMMRLEHGIFDEACISVIAQGTIDGLAEACGRPLDIRRFRANLVIRTEAPQLFEEDAWVGGILAFGDDGPQISITMRDERCAMLNLDPDTAESDPRILKTVVRLNDNKAGVYATVVRTGQVCAGQRVTLRA